MKYICENCAGQNVETCKWVNMNTNEIKGDGPIDTAFCSDCQEHVESYMIGDTDKIIGLDDLDVCIDQGYTTMLYGPGLIDDSDQIDPDYCPEFSKGISDLLCGDKTIDDLHSIYTANYMQVNQACDYKVTKGWPETPFDVLNLFEDLNICGLI